MKTRLVALVAIAPLALGWTPSGIGFGGVAEVGPVGSSGTHTGSVVDVSDSLADTTVAQAGVDVVRDAEDDEFTSPNVTPVGSFPDLTVISTEFATDEPVMYASTLTGIRTYDISDPTAPALLGTLEMAMFQNENVKLGEREDGTKILLVGFDAVGVTPSFEPTDVAGYDEIAVVDVTDPTAPEVTARIETNHRTHTVGCANDECTHAFTSGDDAAFDVIDLEELDAPEIVATITDQPQEDNEAFASGLGHDWDVDDAGVAWWVGTGGIIAYDVNDPTEPVILNSSDKHSQDPEWNSYVSHNSMRPNADDFGGDDEEGSRGGPPGHVPGPPAQRPTPGGAAGDAPGGPPDGSPGGGGTGDRIHVDEGNVLLVTEEDYMDATCESEGSFQTWHVSDLDPSINPEGEQDGGTITPLDQWNSELLGSGIKTPAGAFCSAHYFDYHQDGYVAQGWYQQGMRILDVNDPENIRQVGYWVTGVQETWGAYWVPEYDEDGNQTGDKTNLVYTNDPTRGLEVLEVDLPEERGAARTVEAPVLQSWLQVDPTLAARAESSDFGSVCPLPPGSPVRG